jgi:FkbM family methyltransferase
MRFLLPSVFASLCLFVHAHGTELLEPAQTKMLTAFTPGDAYMKTFPYEKYRICRVPSQGDFYLDTVQDIIKGCLACGYAWEPETDNIIVQHTKKGTIALDLGAHIGTHTLALSKAVGDDGLVIAFEPNPKIYRELCMNLALNGRKNVIPVQCALGNLNGEITICTPVPGNEGGTYVGGGGSMVPLRKLDNFSIRNISFIKMDVENFEDMVLAGGRETLLASRPIIFLEIQGNMEQAAASGGNREGKTRVTISNLEALGYKVSRFSGDNYIAMPS